MAVPEIFTQTSKFTYCSLVQMKRKEESISFLIQGFQFFLAARCIPILISGYCFIRKCRFLQTTAKLRYMVIHTYCLYVYYFRNKTRNLLPNKKYTQYYRPCVTQWTSVSLGGLIVIQLSKNMFVFL